MYGQANKVKIKNRVNKQWSMYNRLRIGMTNVLVLTQKIFIDNYFCILVHVQDKLFIRECCVPEQLFHGHDD